MDRRFRARSYSGREREKAQRGPRHLPFVLLILLAMIILSSRRGEGVDLTVRITGIREVKGQMQLGLYNRAEVFPKEGKQYRLVERPVTGKVFIYTFEQLPAGDYALAVFQDLDRDGLIDKNMLGIPTEPYGFSNNVRPRLSAPAFSRARIRLNSDTTIVISLIH